MQDIETRLFALRDEDYRAFTVKLIPGVDERSVIGVRVPHLRAMAKGLVQAGDHLSFMQNLPHRYHEENLLHGYMLSMGGVSLHEVLQRLDGFLPYVDNWAVCDTITPKVFARNRDVVYRAIRRWMVSGHVYTRRFAVVSSMQFFLDEGFAPYMLDDVAAVPSDEYYVMMAVAWYFSFALIKQWDAALPYIEQNRLPRDVHNMTIRKALDSYRLPVERKDFLKGLRRHVRK